MVQTTDRFNVFQVTYICHFSLDQLENDSIIMPSTGALINFSGKSLTIASYIPLVILTSSARVKPGRAIPTFPLAPFPLHSGMSAILPPLADSGLRQWRGQGNLHPG